MTASLSPSVLAELRAAEQAATPGPWRAVFYPEADQFYAADGLRGESADIDSEAATVAWGGPCEDGGPHLGCCDRADADLIVAARNALPALLAAAEAVEEIRSLCDRYRANCHPMSVQAQCAELFGSLLPPAQPEGATP